MAVSSFRVEARLCSNLSNIGLAIRTALRWDPRLLLSQTRRHLRGLGFVVLHSLSVTLELDD